jgi:hypothetical protein
VRAEDLSQALLDIGPNIVHFAGHGAQHEGLHLYDDWGTPYPVTPETLAALFHLVRNQMKCVVLNACYTQGQALAIANHIRYVIGVEGAISDDAAIAFTVGFYQAMAAGRSIVQAYKFGVVQVRLCGIPEHLMPVLFKKSDVTGKKKGSTEAYG